MLKRPSASFDRIGSSRQLRIASADDLRLLLDLDDVLWVSTSAPTFQLKVDPVLLRRLDRDGRGRLLSNDIRRAVRWMFRALSSDEGINQSSDTLELGHLNAADPDGDRLSHAARRILGNLGLDGAASVSLKQVRDRQRILANGAQNGDGVIPASSVKDPELRAFVQDLGKVMGTVRDAGGLEGVDAGILDRFLASAEALFVWHRRSESRDDSGQSELYPLGDQTPEAFAAYDAIHTVIDDHFARCRVAALNAMLSRPMNAGDCPAEATRNSESAAEYLRDSPLARPDPEGRLETAGPVNPFYNGRLRALTERVLKPLLGESFRDGVLTERDWRRIVTAFAPYHDWQASRPEGKVEELGPTRIAQYVQGPLPDQLRELFRRDLDAAPEMAALDDLEYLILLQRWMLQICNNFVSFPDLFTPARRSMFEEGRLVIDGRIFDLNIRVNNVESHSNLAKRSGIFLFYSEITGRTPEETFHLVTPITAGSIGQIALEKRGVLFDLAGRQWDARVMRIVENPVSLREAIAAPFKRFAFAITTGIEKITTGAEKQVESQIGKATDTLQQGVAEGISAQPALSAVPGVPPAAAAGGAPAAGPGAPGSGRDTASVTRDVMLGGSVAVAALGSSFAYISKTLSEMDKWWIYLVVALVVGAAVILVPTVLLAWFRLRRRNLAGLLEASGWAINAELRLSRSIGRTFCPKPTRPREWQMKGTAE